MCVCVCVCACVCACVGMKGEAALETMKKEAAQLKKVGVDMCVRMWL